MEASQTGPGQPQEGQEGTGAAEGGDEQAPLATTTGQDPQTAPTHESEGEGAAPDSEERNPAREQAPAATDAQDAIIGDPGLRDEQQPLGNEGTPSNADTPHRTSAPPPTGQSGVPLPEDRDAGVQPGDEPQPGAQPAGEPPAGEPPAQG